MRKKNILAGLTPAQRATIAIRATPYFCARGSNQYRLIPERNPSFGGPEAVAACEAMKLIMRAQESSRKPA